MNLDEFNNMIIKFQEYLGQAYYWIIIGLIVLGVILIIVNIKSKNKYEIKKIIGSNFKNLVLVTSISYITKICDSDNVKSITKYYNLIIVFIFAFVIICIIEGIVFNKGERYKILKKYYKYEYYIFGTYLYTNIIVDPINFFNIGLIAVIWMLLGIISDKDNKKDVKNGVEQVDISDAPCLKKDQLFKSREKELDYILKYVSEYKYNESFAISIAGEWGEGKTSIMNILEQEISTDNKFIISIQPMIVDTRESLAKYFFDKLEALFNSYGIYTGKDSPFKEYFESVMNIIGASKSIPINKMLGIEDKKTEDYREKKKALQKDINQLLEVANENNIKNRIIILVDDFDRVDEEVIYSVLTFIKEIVDFRGCVVIFLMDYQKLKDKDISHEYLDKFINKRFDLKKININEILEYYSNIYLNINLDSIALNEQLEILKNNINYYFENVFSVAQESIRNIEKQEALIKNQLSSQKGNNENEHKEELKDEIKNLGEIKNEFKGYIDKFRNMTTNTRKVKKFLRDIGDAYIYIDQYYNDFLEDKLKDFYQLIDCNKITFNMVIIKNFIEKEYEDILDSNDITIYLKKINNISITKKSAEQLLVNNILLSFMKEDAINEIDSIRNDKINSFINNSFINNNKYDDLMDLRTVDQKNLEMIDGNSIIISQDYYDKIIELYDSIMRNQWVDGNDKTKERINVVCEYVSIQVEVGNIQFWEFINLILPDSKREKFITKEFLSKVKKILLNTDLVYINENEKKSNEYTLENIKNALILKKRPLIVLILSLVKITDNNYSYSSIYNDIKQYDKLEGINNSAKQILKFQFDFDNNSDIGNFKRWIMDCIDYIKNELTSYNYIDSTYLENEINTLIESFSIVEFIEHTVKITPIENEYSIKVIYGSESYPVLKDEINKLQNYIEKNSEKINHDTFSFFEQLIIRMEQLSEVNVFDKEVIDDLDKLYYELKQNYNEKLMDYMNWQRCGSKMIKIKINQKNEQTSESK